MKRSYPNPRHIFVLILITLGFLRQTNAQSGTDFWFAPPFVTHVHNAPGGVPIYLLLSSMGASSTVTVSQPANAGFTPIVVTIPASKSKRIDISAFQSQLETHPTNTVLNTGLRIQATTAITANYEEDNTNNPEDFALKGANALGTDFYIPITNWVPFANHNFGVAGQEAIASFDIVAIQNNTVVTIYPPVQVDGHGALTQFSVTLNAGQTYSCGWTGANYTVPSNHPGGAAVHSSAPVAITVKDDSDTNPSGGCYDLIGDQIVPTAILGTDYVAVKGFLNNGGNEGLFITATQSNTNIYIDGNATPIRTMFAGETYRVDMDSITTAADNSVYVHSSLPVYATHVTGFGCEMGSALLPPLNCAGSHQVNFVRSTNEAFYLTILVHTAAINNFTITGPGTATISPASFVSVPGTGGLWMAGRLQFTTTQIPVDSGFSVTNSADVFALGIINGGAATGCRYGYFSEFVAPIVVNAGPDQVICANDTAQLAASITGGSTTGIWTSTGSGSFLPSTTTINAKYAPSAADIAAGHVTLTLSSTSICFPQQDQVLITFTPAPTVNAGSNQTVCKNNPAVTLNGSVTVATGGLWSGGAGTYNPNNTTLNAVYTPTAAEIAAGTLALTLTSTGNGTCHAASNSTIITFSASPVVNAGPTQTVCSNNASVTLNGTVTGATGGIWSGGTGSYSPSATALNAVYSPSVTEISSGSVTLTLTTTGYGNCNAVSSNVVINFSLSPTVNAGPDQNICKNNPAVSLSGAVTVATGGIWSGGLGTYAPSSTALNATYTPTAGEIASGSLTLTLTSTGNGNCTAVSDQMVITFTTAPTVNAGTNQTVCANNPMVTLNGSITLATGGIWSGGTGTYNPNNTTLNATYTPSAAEITAGIATLTLTTTGNANCSAVNKSMTITITPAPVVNAGPDQTLCKNNPNATLAGSVTVAGGGVWSGGSGSFSPTNTTLNAVYSPTVAEIASGSVTLTLTSTANGTCTAVSDQVLLTFSATPTANAGVDQTVCANNAAVHLSGSVTVATGGQWSGGLGTFSPNNNTLNAVYTPTVGEIASGNITLTLTTSGNGNCNSVTDQMVITFTPAPTVNAGPDQTTCKNNPAVTLNGSVTTATGGLWSGGSGTYAPNNTTLNAVYTPSGAEITAGTVTLTLTTTGNGTCLAVSDQMVITLTPKPVVNAGPDQTLCSNNPNATLSGSVTVAGGGVWSGGAGSFSPSNTAMNAIYTPTAGEITSGSVTLTLTSTTNGTCIAVTDQVVLTYSATPTVNAGVDQTVCANNAAVHLSGTVTVASGGVWSGGLGTYAPNNAALNAVYTPTVGEIASGNITLTLTSSGNGNCNAVTDQMHIFVTTAPTVSAGGDQTTCKNNAAVTLNGSVTIASGGIWSGGTGTYAPNNTTLNAVYTPSLAELTAGTVTLTLTTTGNGTCTAMSDQMTITLTPTPVVNAGPDQTLCGNNPDATLSGSVTVAGGGVWSGGAGSFSPSNTAMNAIYTPTAGEISSGSVTLTLTSTANGTCTAVTDQMVIHFTLPPTANAGLDRIVCANNAAVTLNGTVTVASGGQWSGGLGTFSPNSSTLNAVYTPTAGETASGSVTLTLTTTGNGTCNAVTDQMTITFTPAPTVSAGINQTVCANNSAVTLAGSFTGASGILWSGGTGTYNPNNTTPTAIYTPSAAEKTAGTVTLTITTTGNGTCLPVTDNMTITITPAPLANAGADIAACANKSSVTLNGNVTNAVGGIWSGGAGSFAPSNTALNAVYTPTAGEITAGSVSLTLTTTGNGSCNPATDQMNITFGPSPIVNAGVDQTLCGNNATVSLAGSVSNASGASWSGGAGVFSPSASSLNATYVPSQTEINSGLMKLFLTSTGNGSCNAVTDTIALHFTPAPTVNAGASLTSCANNPSVTLSGSHTVSTGAIWSGGLGTFNPNNTTMNATYTPTAAEIASGTVVLRLTTTGNGTCLSVYDSTIITIVPKPLVNAGTDLTVCVTNMHVQLSGSVSGSSNTGQWSTLGTGTFVPNNQALNAIYDCGRQDSINGFVKLILTSTNNGTCLPVTDTMKINILPAGGANAGSSVTVCGNNATVTLNGTITGGASSGVWSTNGTGIFSPNANTLNAQYIASPGDQASGSVTLTLTANSCNPASDNITITITPAPSVNAGVDQTVCSSIHSILLNGSVSGGTSTGLWTSTGTGTFVPNNTTLNATYQTTPADSAAQVIYLVLHSTNNGSCVAVTDTLRLNIYPSTTVNAGPNQTVCGNNAIVTLSGSVSNAGPGLWTTSGSGVFNPNATDMNATYTPSASDITAGSVNLILTATSSCNNAVSFMTVTMTPPPVVSAGPDQSVCGSNPNVTLAGSLANAGGIQWSGGSGTFSPNSTTLNATYTPTHAEIVSGTVTLTITTTGNGNCNAVSDQIVITFTSSIVANAGLDQQVCRSAGTSQLQGIVSNGSTTGIWSTLGSGAFVPNDSTLNAQYHFSSADTAAGSVLLILNSTHNGSCAAATDTMKLIFGPGAFASAGVDQITCSNNTLINLNGFVSGGTTTGQWSTLGNGTFSPNPQTLNAAYTLSTSDLSSGGVKLVLTTTNNGGCLAGTDTMKIIVNSPAIVNAGIDQQVCADAVSVTLNGTVTGSSTTGQWTSSGSGTFSPNAQALNATYAFGPSDITLGHVTLVLSSTNNAACTVVHDTMKITLQQPTTVQAGSDETVCASSPAVTLNGIISGGTITGVWTSLGSGSFTPNSQALNAVFTPGPSDLALGKVTLVLTSTNTGLCSTKTDTLVITYHATPVANAGLDQVLCSTTGGSLTLNGTVTGSTTTGQWTTLGSGTFSPNAQTLHAIYTPSASDITNGHVLLILQTTNNGVCGMSADTMQITFGTKPLAAFTSTINGLTATFSDQSTGASAWLWDFGNSSGQSTQQNPIEQYNTGGTYTVSLIVTSSMGCTDTTYALVILNDATVVHPVAVPSGFTPNGDHINDEVMILGGPFVEVDLKIYNQWGNMVFSSSDPTAGWDGKYKGIDQPAGVYIYTAKGKTIDGKTFNFSGDVTLIR